MKKLLLLLFLTIATGNCVWAQKFTITVDGYQLTFQVLSERDKTAEVVFDKKNKFKGEVCHIPSTVQYQGTDYTVSEIGEKAFKDLKKLQTVYLPNTITKISIKAFYNCGMTQIQLPESLVEIQDEAFMGTHLERIEIPASVKRIGARAFFSFNKLMGQPTRIKWLSIPLGVEEIGDHAFSKFVNGYGVWHSSSPEIISLPKWVTSEKEAKRIGIHGDSFNNYINKR